MVLVVLTVFCHFNYFRIIDYSQTTNLYVNKGSSKLGKLIKAMREHDVFGKTGFV
jgi:hypothetical protein